MKNESPIVLISAVVKGQAAAKPVDLVDRVMSLTYEDSDTKTDKLTLSVRNDDLANFDAPVWRKGMELVVQWGYYNNLSPPRNVIVKSVKGFTTLTVECAGKGALMGEVKKTRSFKGKTRSQVVEEIAESYGYGPDARFITATNRTFNTIAQGGKTDGELVSKLAKEEGFQFYIDVDGFHWHEREFDKPPVRTFSWGAARENAEAVIDEPQIDVDLTVPRPKAIRARGIDRKTGKPFEVVASNTETDRLGLAPTLEGLDDWSALLTTSDTEQVNVAEPPELTDDNVIEVVDPRDKTTALLLNEQALREGTEEIADAGSHDATDAKTKADARYKKLQQTTVKMTIKALGDPSFGAKSVFRFEAQAPGHAPCKRLSGNYFAKAVTHEVTPGSYTMTIEAISDGSNGEGKKSGAKVNDQKPADTGADATSKEEAQHELEEIEIVDPRDKTTSIYYR